MAASTALQAITFNVVDNYIGQDNGAFENTDDYTHIRVIKTGIINYSAGFFIIELDILY